MRNIQKKFYQMLNDAIKIAEIKSYLSIILTFIVHYIGFTLAKIMLIYSLLSIKYKSGFVKLSSDEILNQVLNKHAVFQIIIIAIIFLGPAYQLFMNNYIAVRDNNVTHKMFWFPIIIALLSVLGFLIINILPNNWLLISLIIGFTTIASLCSFIVIMLATILPVIFCKH